MTINDGLPRSLSELNSRPSRWCIRVPRENEYHYVRELVERQVIDLRYTPTAAMVADGFTKALPPVQLATLLKSLGLQTTGTERHAMASEHAMVAVITPHDCNSGKTYAHLVATAPSIAATLTSEITCYDCYDHL